MDSLHALSRKSPKLAARRVRLTLQKPVEVPDTLGGAAITFTDDVTLWAQVEALGGLEDTTAARVQGVIRTRITLRWRDDIKPAMRFRLGMRLFEISSVFDADAKRRNLTCLCEEITE